MPYPDSAISFAAINNGDTIQATDVGDVRTEVAAIEAGLLQGTARINSSGSTVTTLNVAGASTLAGAVTFGAGVASTASFASSVTFSSGVNFVLAPVFDAGLTLSGSLTLSTGGTVSTGVIRQNSLPMWNVFSTVSLARGTGSSEGMVFNAQTFVRGSCTHSTATTSSRIGVNTTGVYQISYHSQVRSTNSPFVMATLFFNDATAIMKQGITHGSTAKNGFTLNGLVRVSDTGYFTVVTGSSGDPSTHGNSTIGEYAARFMGHFVG